MGTVMSVNVKKKKKKKENGGRLKNIASTVRINVGNSLL